MLFQTMFPSTSSSSSSSTSSSRRRLAPTGLASSMALWSAALLLVLALNADVAGSSPIGATGAEDAELNALSMEGESLDETLAVMVNES